MSIFDDARAAITPSVVEHFTASPDAYWSGNEYWTLNPMRSDTKIGSFSINAQGLWNDFAGESGDLVSLLVQSRNLTKKQAAEEIIRAAGGIVPDQTPAKTTRKKPDKPLPMIPIPNGELAGLKNYTKAAWCSERYGEPVKAWVYRNYDGGAVFATVRFEKADGSKDIVPWYFGVDQKWHAGHAIEHGRPLFRLDQLVKCDASTIFIIVEGEKCASIEVNGYFLTSWPGGSSAVSYTDWAPLEHAAIEGRVLIWPDADRQLDKHKVLIPWEKQPGMKAAIAIANRLPGARIIDVKAKASIKDGWDIADAVAEGIDPVAYIAANMPAAANTVDGNAGEFACLGHDQTHHWFLRRGVRMPYRISIGAFTSSKIGSLAPLAYWALQGMTNDQGGLKTSVAQDYIESLSFSVGQYRPERIRGAGVWRDKDGFLINDGSKLIQTDGTVVQYDEHQSSSHYIASQVEFGQMTGHDATADEGKTLAKLFLAQGWANPTQAALAMGWALMAPFGGVLRWRPHTWITGRRGTGKSWVLSDLMAPLCGPFAHIGSGKDSEAGLRRSLDMDARPVILDEMEPKGQRAAERVSAILDLARNASSDGSGYITMASPDGGVQRFVVRSCFCFGSIQTPDEGAAIASRITMLELRVPQDQRAKFRESAGLYANCMDDPSRFRRRTFRALGRIQLDIEFLRTEQLAVFGEQRRADQLAPLLAAAWAGQSDESIQGNAGIDWLAELSTHLGTESETVADDEEAVMGHILAAHIRIKEGVKTVAELLKLGYVDMLAWAQEELARYGIKVYSGGLAIKAKSDQIRALLKDTPYSGGYGAQIRRHRYAQGDSTRQVRMAGGHAQCYVLDWHKFREDYIGGDQMELPEEAPF